MVHEVLQNYLFLKLLGLWSAISKIKGLSVLLKYPKADFNLLSAFGKVICVIKGQLGNQFKA